MALNTSQSVALGQDGQFRQRVRNLMMLEAAAVYAESAATPNHNARVAYAFKLFNQPSLADLAADFLATRTNVINSTVSYDYDRRAVLTDATDAAIRSQIATDWNLLAGV